MKRITLFLNLFTNLGANPNSSRLGKKEIILSNKISLLLIPCALLGMSMSFASEVYFTAIGCSLFLLFLIGVFPLNKSGYSLVSRFGLAVLPQFFLLLPNVISGIGKEENYLTFSFVFLAFSILPLLLFRERKHSGILIAALLINFLVMLFFDVLMAWSASNEIDFQLIENNYIYYKFPQIILWVVIVAAFQYIKFESASYEAQLKLANSSLMEYTDEIQSQNEEILAQSESLVDKQQKIERQLVKLENSNNELKNTKLELIKTIENLEAAKDKLEQKEADASSILNALNEQYLVAQYDLEGNLLNINTKVIELLGVLQNESFKHIKPRFDQKPDNGTSYNGNQFGDVWKDVINGNGRRIELKYSYGNEIKYLATTFAPLCDKYRKPYKILAIGQDITELVEKTEKIDLVNEELEQKAREISQLNELLNFQQKEIFYKNEELHRQKLEIEAITNQLK